MRVKIEMRLERPSTGSVLNTGFDFQVAKGETREDHTRIAEKIVYESFSGWRISEMEFV